MANAAAPTPKANMGAPSPRLDAQLKVTGQARYPSDAPVGNPAFAVLVTSVIAKGRIERLDLDGAHAVPGILDILTHENTGELKGVKFGQGSATSIEDLAPKFGKPVRSSPWLWPTLLKRQPRPRRGSSRPMQNRRHRQHSAPQD